MKALYAEEERRLVRRAALVTWEEQQPLGQGVPQQHKMFKILILNSMVIIAETKFRGKNLRN